MARYCKFTGQERSSGNGLSIKPMCVNCKSFTETETDCACVNKAVLEMKTNDLLKNLPEGIEVESIVLKRMVLKDPSKKCGKHELDADGIRKYVNELIGNGYEVTKTEIKAQVEAKADDSTLVATNTTETKPTKKKLSISADVIEDV